MKPRDEELDDDLTRFSLSTCLRLAALLAIASCKFGTATAGVGMEACEPSGLVEDVLVEVIELAVTDEDPVEFELIGPLLTDFKDVAFSRAAGTGEDGFLAAALSSS
jgi:hypothetical protein